LTNVHIQLLLRMRLILYSAGMSTSPAPPLPRLASIDRSQLLLHTVDVERLTKGVTGRCEKIDLQTWSVVGAKKSRSRMLYKRPLRCQHTFRIKTKIAKILPNRIFHIFQTERILRKRRDLTERILKNCVKTHDDLNVLTGRNWRSSIRSATARYPPSETPNTPIRRASIPVRAAT
jgi:hypothetical protein